MENIKDYIASGILELYALGVTGKEENEEIEEMALSHPEVSEEIKKISVAIESYAKQNVVIPDPTIKPFLLAVIDYTERLKSGMQQGFPPVLNEVSKIGDYAEWINRADIKLPKNLIDFHVKIIGHTPQVTTSIIWVKDMAPQEVHHNEFEKFLILEGTCNITIEGEVHSLKAGDFLSIPLHKKHDLKITSSFPCKAILQRIAA